MLPKDSFSDRKVEIIVSRLELRKTFQNENFARNLTWKKIFQNFFPENFFW